jgi:CDP-paratose 2-epimerase
MKALITGGAGFIGSYLARRFVESRHGAEVVAFDNLRRLGSELNLKSFKQLGIRFVHGDVRHLTDLETCGTDFDLFIEASAEPSVKAGLNGTPDYVVETNLMGAFNCLKFARNHARKFIFLSTSRVYSIELLRAIALEETSTRFVIKEHQTLPGISAAGISEEFSTNLPRSFYGATKLAAECLVQEFTDTFGLDSIIYRCGVVAGPGQFGNVDQGVFTLWVARHYFRQSLQYTGFGGAGKQVRDLLHPADLFDLINLESTNCKPGAVYNVGGGPEISTSLAELTDLCRNIVGTKIAIGSNAESSAVDIPLFITDSRRVSSDTRWHPTRGVEAIVSDIFNWIRGNEADLRPYFT